MSALLYSLQLRDNQKAEDNQQGPGTHFCQMDQLPPSMLVRILPGPKERRDVFRDPQEKTEQQKRRGYRQGVGRPADGKMGLGAPEQEENQQGQPERITCSLRQV